MLVMDSEMTLTPRKKLHVGFPASLVSPCKSSLRLKPKTQTNTIRMSPRKKDQPPFTPTRGQMTAETPGRGSKNRQTTEDGAQVKQNEAVSKKDIRAAELQRDADMLHTIKSKTQVMLISNSVLFLM